MERTRQRHITRRRICWPEPDATCLEGGCGYCNLSRFRSVNTIRRYAQKAGEVPNRYGDTVKQAIDAFNWGQRHNFANADIEWSDA